LYPCFSSCSYSPSLPSSSSSSLSLKTWTNRTAEMSALTGGLEAVDNLQSCWQTFYRTGLHFPTTETQLLPGASAVVLLLAPLGIVVTFFVHEVLKSVTSLFLDLPYRNLRIEVALIIF
jgi:hypothetical protein